jgi:uncharacterized membrane protein YjjP (DUF1212 family)
MPREALVIHDLFAILIYMNDETRNRKRRSLDEADRSGDIADSMEVRGEIMRRIHAGEITLEEGQAELKKIKSAAKKNGKLTRLQKWSQS